MTTENDPADALGLADDELAPWTADDEAQWQAEMDAPDPPWLARKLVQLREQAQARLAAESADELANRRAIKDVIARCEQITPAEWARRNADIAVFENAHVSLQQGREAFDRGEFHRAAYLLGIAAAHGTGDSILFLAATYRVLRQDTLAAAWLEIAAEEGYDERQVERLARIAATRTKP